MAESKPDWEPGCMCGPCVRKREAYVPPNRIEVGTKVRFPRRTNERFRIYTVTHWDPHGLWILQPENPRAEEEVTYLSDSTMRDPSIVRVVP